MYSAGSEEQQKLLVVIVDIGVSILDHGSDSKESAIQETWVQSLGQEDPLEKGMSTHSSILAWRIPWTEELGRLQSMGSQRAGHDCVTNTFTFKNKPQPCHRLLAPASAMNLFQGDQSSELGGPGEPEMGQWGQDH